MDRDQYDSFLERCAKEVNLNREFGKDGAKEVSEETCQSCYCKVPLGSRHCPSCGTFRSIPEGILENFKPVTIFRKNLAITLLGLETRVEIEGRMYTRVYLKIKNLTQIRVHISLTYVDSVLLDVTGRQYSPIDSDEFIDDPREPIFPTWFHIYPDAFKDGVLLFKESSLPLQKAIICAMHQENEDELFVFDVNSP